jgi:hypothetical protein
MCSKSYRIDFAWSYFSTEVFQSSMTLRVWINFPIKVKVKLNPVRGRESP